MEHSLLNLNIIMKKSLYNLYSFMLIYSTCENSSSFKQEVRLYPGGSSPAQLATFHRS